MAIGRDELWAADKRSADVQSVEEFLDRFGIDGDEFQEVVAEWGQSCIDKELALPVEQRDPFRFAVASVMYGFMAGVELGRVELR